MLKDEVIQDVKALGGFPIFIIAIIFSFFLKDIKLSAELAVGLILSFGLTFGIRAVYFKQRPIKQKFETAIEKIDASSFPSLHSVRAAVLATLLILHFPNLWLRVVFAVAAVGVAVARVLQKRHYAKDVVVGLVLGVVLAFASMEIVSLLPL